MKSRMWVLIVFMLLLATLALYVTAFRLLDINQKACDYVTEKIAQSFNADFSAGSLSILPWSIRINRASLRLKETPLSIEVKRIRIGYNIFHLLVYRLRPLRGTQDVYIEEPVVTWRFDRADYPDTIRIDRRYDFLVEDIPPIRVNIVRGSFVFQRGDSVLVCVDNISGWFDDFNNPVVPLNIQGNVLSDEVNMTCRGYIDKVKDTIVVDLATKNAHLAVEGVEVISGDINPQSGTIDFDIHYEKIGDESVVTGTYGVKDGSFLLKEFNLGVSDFSIQGHFDEQIVYFDMVTGTVWGVTPELSGQIALKPELSLTMAVDAEGIDLARVMTDLFPGKTAYPTGSLDLAATLTGPVNDITTDVAVTMDSLRYRNETVVDIAANIDISRGVLTFENFSSTYRGYLVEGSGTSRNVTGEESKNVTLTMTATNISSPSDKYAFNITSNFNPSQDRYNADISMKIKQFDHPINGRISLVDDRADFHFSNDSFNVEGTVSEPFDHASVATSVTLSHFPVLEYAGRGGSEHGFFIDGTGTVQGSLDTLSVDGGFKLNWGKNLNSQLTGTATVTNIMKDSRSFIARARLSDHHLRYSHPMAWDVSARSDSLGIMMEVVSNEGAYGVVGVSPESGELSGFVDFTSFPLERIIDIFVREEFSHRGKITGSVRIGGTMTAPNFASDEPLRVSGLKLGGLDRLDGALYFSGSSRHLRFSDADIRRDGIPIGHADGWWDSGTPFFLDAEGRDVELAAISDILSDRWHSNGRANYTIKTVFTLKQGTIEGSATVRDGHFLDIPFDTASANISGGSTGFKVTDMSIEKAGLYTATGSAASGYLWRDRTDTPGLNMNLSLNGDLVRIFPYLTTAIKTATGNCRANITIGGTWQEPIPLAGELEVTDGTIEPSFLFNQVTGINGTFFLDPEFVTVSGFKAFRIRSCTGLLEGKRLIVNNFHPGDPEWEQVVRPELLNVMNESINLDFGVFTGYINPEKNRDTSIEIHIPGFMKGGEEGIFEIAGMKGDRFLVGATDDGENMTPYISGEVTVRSGDVNYPLLPDEDKEGGDDDSGSFIEDIFWDLVINSGSNVNYVNEYNFTIGRFAGTTLWQNEVKIDENSHFTVTGRFSDGSFRVTGNARSSFGYVVYYGYRFEIEWAEFELDTTNERTPCIITGRARTIVVNDSTGVNTEIYLHLNFVDRESGRIIEARGGTSVLDDDYYGLSRPQTRFDAGVLGIIEIRFTSNDPSDDTQEKILAKLGISPSSIGAVATRAFATGMDNFYFNPLVRPFEERLRKMFRLDMVKITPSFFGSFAQSRLGFSQSRDPSSDYIYFNRSRIMLGEFVMKDIFLTYIGQYGVGRDYLLRKERGFFHDIGLQYLIERNLRLQLHYYYDDIINEQDKRFEFRYDFQFE